VKKEQTKNIKTRVRLKSCCSESES